MKVTINIPENLPRAIIKKFLQRIELKFNQKSRSI